MDVLVINLDMPTEQSRRERQGCPIEGVFVVAQLRYGSEVLLFHLGEGVVWTAFFGLFDEIFLQVLGR